MIVENHTASVYACRDIDELIINSQIIVCVLPVTFTASVEFERTVYTVIEDAGSVQVCAVKREEITTEELLLMLYTEDDTAHGTYYS